MTGALALVGGGEFGPGCDHDVALLEVSGARSVVVLPTAAAFEHPERSVQAAEQWFGSLGAEVRGLMVLRRAEAFDPEPVEIVRASRFTYLAGDSPMHLRSVLKDTPLWDALVAAYDDGGVVAGSAAGAMVLTDPMVDPRGGAFTLGLGLVKGVAVVPHAEQWSADRLHRTLDLADSEHQLPVLALDTASAAVRAPEGTWTTHGRVTLYRGRMPVSLDGLVV